MSRFAFVAAERPILYAGQGVHYAEAWTELRALAELLGAPVTTSLQGKSAFPEDHPLSLGSGGRTVPRPVDVFMGDADLVFGIGASFTLCKVTLGVDLRLTDVLGKAHSFDGRVLGLRAAYAF